MIVDRLVVLLVVVQTETLLEKPKDRGTTSRTTSIMREQWPSKMAEYNSCCSNQSFSGLITSPFKDYQIFQKQLISCASSKYHNHFPTLTLITHPTNRQTQHLTEVTPLTNRQTQCTTKFKPLKNRQTQRLTEVTPLTNRQTQCMTELIPLTNRQTQRLTEVTPLTNRQTQCTTKIKPLKNRQTQS